MSFSIRINMCIQRIWIIQIYFRSGRIQPLMSKAREGKDQNDIALTLKNSKNKRFAWSSSSRRLGRSCMWMADACHDFLTIYQFTPKLQIDCSPSFQLRFKWFSLHWVRIKVFFHILHKTIKIINICILGIENSVQINGSIIIWDCSWRRRSREGFVIHSRTQPW